MIKNRLFLLFALLLLSNELLAVRFVNPKVIYNTGQLPFDIPDWVDFKESGQGAILNTSDGQEIKIHKKEGEVSNLGRQVKIPLKKENDLAQLLLYFTGTGMGNGARNYRSYIKSKRRFIGGGRSVPASENICTKDIPDKTYRLSFEKSGATYSATVIVENDQLTKTILDDGNHGNAIKLIYDLSIDSTVSDNRTKKQRWGSMPPLAEYEVSAVDAILSGYKGSQYKHTSDLNILETLKAMSLDLADKLQVVIATHGGNELISYFRTRCDHNTFLLANTENGLVIFDARVKGSTIITPSDWLKNVYNNETIEFILNCPFRRERDLPQFRFINGLTYIEQYDEADAFEIRHPDFLLKHSGEELKSKLWESSFSFNLYEVCQFFKGNLTYEDMLIQHKNFQSPLTRLTDDNILFLRQLFKSC